MPPPLPERYQLEVRLGRDFDIEEWLATDTALERPVLVRVLGPETTASRRSEFIASVGGAAGVNHNHVASVFAADFLPDGAYSISEWAGGVTLSHRKAAGDTMPVREFLPNAAGLASGLSALHGAGVLHGALDAGSVLYSVDHPAKLAAFGRPSSGASAVEDVRKLAETLETAVTGQPPGDMAPSQIVDGLGPAVDAALRRAQDGEVDAATLAELLRASPSAPKQNTAEPSASWRPLYTIAGLLVVALILIGVGKTLTAQPSDPLLFPVGPTPTSALESSTSTTSTTAQVSELSVQIVEVLVFDPPPGDGTEHNREIDLVTDGDSSTPWRTERYFDPLPLIKDGVGLIFVITGTPESIDLLGVTNDTGYGIYWSNPPAQSLDGWERVAAGTISNGRASTALPQRTDGSWLVWLTDVPPHAEGGYVGAIGEVRFQP